MRIFFILLIILFLLLAFVYYLSINKTGYWVCQNGQWLKKGNPNYPQPKVSCPKKISLPKTRQECEEQGGVWKKWGLAPAESCNKKTTDAGTPCQDSDECEGICKVNLSREELKNAMNRNFSINKNSGQCSQWILNFGCFGKMEKGKVRVICVD